jgi:hypothetical protein
MISVEEGLQGSYQVHNFNAIFETVEMGLWSNKGRGAVIGYSVLSVGDVKLNSLSFIVKFRYAIFSCIVIACSIRIKSSTVSRLTQV